MKRELGRSLGGFDPLVRRLSFGALAAALALAVSSQAIAREMIPVKDIDELYDEINRVKNVGALLVLAKGDYKLDPTRPHCGRLELLRDMGIRGVSGDPDEVRIDASELYPPPPSASACSEPRTGAVRTGRGNNSVEWLSVFGAVGPSSAITTDLFADGRTKVRIAHVVAAGSARGIDVRNSGAILSSRQLEVDLADNILHHNVELAGNVPGQGLRVANVGTNGASISVTLSASVMTDNTVGCLAANLNATQSSVRIESSDNAFEGNGNGCVLLGGVSDGTAGSASDNVLSWEDHGSSFIDNDGAQSSAASIPGALVAIAGQVSGGTQSATGNTLQVILKNSTFADNPAVDINAFAAKTSSGQTATGNVLQLDLSGGSKNARLCLTEPSDNTIDGSGLPSPQQNCN